MYILGEKLRNLVPYEPLAGEYPVRLDANESFLPLPGEVKAELFALLANTPMNRYPDPLARECCAAFADYYGVDERYVTAGNGSDELISVITGAFMARGDTLVSLDPDFSMYPFYGALSECRLVRLCKRDDLSVDVDGLIRAANRENARMIIFSNPCNPTSLGIPKEDARRIVTETKALVVLDEAYMDFWDQSLLEEAHLYDNLIVLRTCSKMIGLAAVRLGFAVACDTLTKALRAAKSPYNVNALTQKAGALILSKRGLLQSAAREILRSRDELYESLRGLPGCTVFRPRTNFVLIGCARAREIFEYLRGEGVLVRCLGDCLRVTAGTPKENKTVTELLHKFFKNMV